MATKYSIVDVDNDDESADLQFHDIPHSVSMEEEIDTSAMTGKKSQTHTFTKFPQPEESDDDGDKADLLTGEKKSASFWKFEYYQTFFDVDTFQVMRRVLGSAVPNPRTNFLEHHIRPNPDMYGPFWICTTLVFTTAIAGNMANYFHAGVIHEKAHDFKWHYDFHKVTFAATAVFGYWWVIPTLLWGLLWWRGSRAGFTYLEIICVYGYSIAIYIPISILFVIPYNWLHWILVLIGMLLSGTVLLFTFWPAVRDDDKKIGIAVMGFIMLFHGLLATGFVLYFFHVPSIPLTPISPNSTVVTPHVNNTVAGVVPKNPPTFNMSSANRVSAHASPAQNAAMGNTQSDQQQLLSSVQKSVPQNKARGDMPSDQQQLLSSAQKSAPQNKARGDTPSDQQQLLSSAQKSAPQNKARGDTPSDQQQLLSSAQKSAPQNKARGDTQNDQQQLLSSVQKSAPQTQQKVLTPSTTLPPALKKALAANSSDSSKVKRAALSESLQKNSKSDISGDMTAAAS